MQNLNPGGPTGRIGYAIFVGHFDGKPLRYSDFVPFVSNEKAVWLDHGSDNYAGVTWSDVPASDGRRQLFLGWMSSWSYATVVPTGLWRSAMTLPLQP